MDGNSRGFSVGQLDTTPPRRPSQDQRLIAEALRSAREAAGYTTAAVFAREAGVNYAKYHSHETGARGFDKETEALYARLLNVPKGSILGAKRAMKFLPAQCLVPILGTIAEASARITSMPLGEAITRELPVDLTTLSAHVVVGSDLYPLLRDGDHVLHRRLDPDNFSLSRVNGYECVVRLASGSECVRVVRLQPNGKYTLLSWSIPPSYDQEITAAEPVEMIIRNVPH